MLHGTQLFVLIVIGARSFANGVVPLTFYNVWPNTPSSICFLYGNSANDIITGNVQKVGPSKFNETVMKNFTNTSSQIFLSIITATGANCANTGPSIVGGIKTLSLSSVYVNLIGYGPSIQSNAALLAPQLLHPNGSINTPSGAQMTLIKVNYGTGFTSCSAVMLEGLNKIGDFGPYNIGAASGTNSRLPIDQLQFTWTCDGTVVGTLTRPKNLFCNATSFIVAVVGKKGGVGNDAPFVKVIPGRACPIPPTTTTTTTTTETTTVTTSTLNASGSPAAGFSGPYRGSFMGVAGGAERIVTSVLVDVFVLLALGNMLW